MAYRASNPYRLDYRPLAGGSDRGHSLATINYALYIAGFFTGITAIVGVVLAYLQRGNASPIVRSHMDWQIRIFWHCILAGLAIFVLHAVVLGLAAITFGVGMVFMVIPWAIGAWWLVWTIWAIIKGLTRLSRNQAI